MLELKLALNMKDITFGVHVAGRLRKEQKGDRDRPWQTEQEDRQCISVKRQSAVFS